MRPWADQSAGLVLLWMTLCGPLPLAAQEPAAEPASETGTGAETGIKADTEADTKADTKTNPASTGQTAAGSTASPPPPEAGLPFSPDEAQREAALFGAGPADPRGGDRDEASIFGGGDPSSAPPSLMGQAEVQARLDEEEDKLEIGGLTYLRLQYQVSEAEVDYEERPLSAPSLVDVYLDARPNDRLRAYLRGRLAHDFSVSEGDTNVFGEPVEPTRIYLDQLWMKLDVERVVFLTVGRQPVRWGAGRFWNPTDFLNQQRRNPLEIFDERLGVNLIKAHLPIEALGWNLYAVAQIDSADQPEKVGGALRAEAAFEQSEISLTVAARKDQPLRLGADISAGVGPFDLHTEASVQHGVRTPFWRGNPLWGGEVDVARFKLPEQYSREDDWIPQLVVGADLSLRYSDQDSVTLGVEYFFNDAGYDDPAFYPWLFIQGAYTPFYVGRHYASAVIVLMAPGDWNDSSFVLSGLANLSDETGVLRFDSRVRVLTQLQLNGFVMWHLGEQGEFHQGVELPSLPELPDGISVPAPHISLGVGMTLRY